MTTTEDYAALTAALHADLTELVAMADRISAKASTARHPIKGEIDAGWRLGAISEIAAAMKTRTAKALERVS